MKRSYLLYHLLTCLLFLPLIVNAQPGTITPLFGSGGGVGYAPPVENAPDSTATFRRITSFFKDTAGNYFIADCAGSGYYDTPNHGSYRIRKIDALTHQVYTIAGNGYRGYSGDGGPAVLAKVSTVTAITADHAGNLIFLDGSHLRKVNLATNIISTLASTGGPYILGLYVDRYNNIFYSCNNSVYKLAAGTYASSIVANTVGFNGFSGDGGPAVAAKLNQPTSITGDRHNNLYVYDQANYRIRKIDSAGIITTFAGSGGNLYSGDGGPALSAVLTTSAGYYYNYYYPDQDDHDNLYPTQMLQADTAGNIYVISHFGSNIIRRITPDGHIGKVAFGMFGNPDHGDEIDEGRLSKPVFQLNPDGSVLFCSYNRLLVLSHTWQGIKTLSIRDTIVTPACTLPVVKLSIYGTVAHRPATGDSVKLKIDYNNTLDSIHYLILPYQTSVDAITGDTTYSFGSTSYTVDSFGYTWPGQYSPWVTITAIDDFQDAGFFPNSVRAATTCNPSWHDIRICRIQDTITTPPCVFPANVRRTLRGKIKGGILTNQDSVYINFFNGDFSETRGVVPVDLEHYTVESLGMVDTDYDGIEDYTIWDTTYSFSYTYNHSYMPQPYVSYDYITHAYGSYYNSAVWLTSNSGYEYIYASIGELTYVDTAWPGVNVPACDSGTAYLNAHIVDSFTSCHNTIPYNGRITINGSLQGTAALYSSIPIHVNFGDGSDTAIRVTNIWIDDGGIYRFSVPDFRHMYTFEGTYRLHITLDTTGVSLIRPFGSDSVILTTSCSPVSGKFFIDANHNCVADSGEVMLGHWPFVVVNNTTHDTTNYWCDEWGNYHIPLSNSYSYSIISTHQNYYDGTSIYDSLTPSCPAGGIYNVTAAAGVSFTQNFGFECSGVGGSVDMNVAGFGWGLIPGDTGVLSIWGSNDWGYMCDTLSSTVTLIKDNRLTYIGMWNGPAPSSVSGDTLTWHFSTAAGLLDFSANVKVSCVTTATMGDTLHNRVMITPTALPDPSLTNNDYSWSEPVRTSWDPNEKEVSPKGYGPEGYIENGTALNYMVHFQNTGTARARHITVVDTLSEALDLSTLQLTSASASVVLIQAGDNVVKFRFNDINLPDSTTDLEGSNGFVSFNILPKDDLPAGTQIQNTANIYFDYNPAVVTNTTINTIEDSTRMITGSGEVCVDGTITLSNALPGGVWSATNGNATVSATGVVSGVHPGIDTIVYTVYGNKSVYKLVTILGIPDPGVITGSNMACVAGVTTLTNTVTGGTWSSSSSAATVIGGVVSGVSSGTAIISYSATNICGAATDTMEVTINPLPDAGTITGVAAVCQLVTTTLTGTVAGGTWSSSSSTATVADGVVTGSAAGTAIISYSVTNLCGTATDTMLFTINPLPDAGTITGVNTICPSATTTLSNLVTGGMWTSSSSAATIADGVVTGISAGTSVISYTVINDCGSSVDTMEITISSLPDAGSIAGPATICASASDTLTATVTGGSWSTATGLVSVSATGGITASATGTDTVLYIVSTACGADTATQAITVTGLPDAGAITGVDTICQGSELYLVASEGGGTWSSSNTGILSVTTSGLLTASTPGTATISYSVSNSCGTATATHSMYVVPEADCNPSGVGNITQQPITIYPNPSSGTFMVQIPGAVNNVTITVTDVSGKVLQVLRPQPGQHLTQVSLTNLASGTYMIKVEADGVQYRDKLVLW
jgi:hypothetical protein